MSVPCSCSRRYTVAEYRALRFVGWHQDGPFNWLELRNCVCRSTMALRVVRLPKRFGPPPLQVSP